jgi:hypothetical protein
MTQEELDARAALIAAMQPKTFEERYAEMLKAASIVENERAKAKWGMIPTKVQRERGRWATLGFEQIKQDGE